MALTDSDMDSSYPLPARPAIFLDKDGTLVENVPYNVSPVLLHFMPGVFEALQQLALCGYALIVVTNQSGIARGYFTEAQFRLLRKALELRVWESAGIRLNDVLHCPHAPDAMGRPTCRCRKPAPGLLKEAAARHRIDLKRSWIVGDTLDDIEAGHSAGCQGLLLHSGGETEWRRSPAREPDAIALNWGEAMQTLTRDSSPLACPSDGSDDLASARPGNDQT